MWNIQSRSDYRDERARGKTPGGIHDLALSSGSIDVEVDSSSQDKKSLETALSPNRSLHLVEHIRPAPKLMICGAGDVAIELIRLGQRLGWRTTLIDPRPRWVELTVQNVRPDEVIDAWPSAAALAGQLDPATACVACSHDGKLDLPFLENVLQLSPLYVGSVGSRVTQAERTDYLEHAVGPELAALHRGPAGLRIADNSAAGIALSIVAEISQSL
jgi:xanthine dehydrogenase accessory factor